MVTLGDIDFTSIPLHIKSGAVIPMRSESGYTTTDVRNPPFSFIVVPTAAGALYLDDGESIVQHAMSEIKMRYQGKMLTVDDDFSLSGGIQQPARRHDSGDLQGSYGGLLE